jgi:hypothetical protein
MRAAFFSSLVFLVLALWGSAAPALAQRAQGVLPLDRILPEIRRSHPGHFYDADGPSAGPDGSQHYHLKWMTPDGRIEWLDTDARTGRVLGSSPGRDTFDLPSRAPVAPVEPAYRGRFLGGDNGTGANDREPDRFTRRGEQDYGNGQDGNRNDRNRDKDGNRDSGGRFRER